MSKVAGNEVTFDGMLFENVSAGLPTSTESRLEDQKYLKYCHWTLLDNYNGTAK